MRDILRKKMKPRNFVSKHLRKFWKPKIEDDKRKKIKDKLQKEEMKDE